MFFNFMQSLFGTNARPDLEQKQVATNAKKISSPSEPKTTKQVKAGSKYDSDVEALEANFGSFKTGLCIETTLQELLQICPRKRPRIEAYQGLISHLKARYETTLIIKSRKTK